MLDFATHDGFSVELALRLWKNRCFRSVTHNRYNFPFSATGEFTMLLRRLVPVAAMFAILSLQFVAARLSSGASHTQNSAACLSNAAFCVVFQDKQPPADAGSDFAEDESEREPAANNNADRKSPADSADAKQPTGDTPSAALPNASPAQQALRDAIEQLSQQSSISARMLESVMVLGRGFKAEGRYLQGNIRNTDRLLRVELKFKAGGAEGSLLEVCDGDILWTRRDVGKDTEVTRRNVAEILAAAKTNNVPVRILDTDLGFGGLPELLVSLDQAMVFTAIKKDSLRQRPVVVIQGGWNENLANNLRGSTNPQDPLPTWMPDLARLYLDAETGFPHRILYLKRVPGRDTLKPMLTLEFLDVQVGEPLDRAEFEFRPPTGVDPRDITMEYIKRFTRPETPAGAAAGAPATPGDSGAASADPTAAQGNNAP